MRRRGKRSVVPSSSATWPTVSSRSTNLAASLHHAASLGCRKIVGGSPSALRLASVRAACQAVRSARTCISRWVGGMWSGSAGVTRSQRVGAAVVGCRKIEHGHEPGFAVGAVVGEGLAGPFAGDQDAASGVAEVLVAVGFAPAQAGDQVRAGVLGLDAVAEPVRAAGRAWLIPQSLGEPGGVIALGVGVGGVASGDLLGQVLGEVADAAAGVFGSGEHALGVELGPEPGDVPGLDRAGPMASRAWSQVGSNSPGAGST